MARARTIKPGFFTNDALASLPMATRLLFAGLWTIADRDGRLLDRPRKIKADVMPYDDMDPDQALEQLAAAGFVVRYVADEQHVIEVIHWAKHQNPHPREAPSELPPRTGSGRTKDMPSNAGTLTIPSFPSGSSGIGVTPSPARAGARARARDSGQPSDCANTCGACGTQLKASERRRKLPLCGECHGKALFAAQRAERPVDLLNAQDLVELAIAERCDMKQAIPRPCKTTDCPNEAEPRDDFCIECQLSGKAPPLRPDKTAIITRQRDS